MGSRVQPDTLLAMKEKGEPITMLTCYDYPSALFQDAADVDLIFIGDSVGTNVLGYDSPNQVTMDDMVLGVLAGECVRLLPDVQRDGTLNYRLGGRLV